MTYSILAIYENGVFKPLETPNLPEKEQVRITVEVSTKLDDVAAPNGQSDPLANVRASTGIKDLAEKFDEYRFGKSRT
jgi:predicted DNA-binding antitoxin AbrB/MazE fold protein